MSTNAANMSTDKVTFDSLKRTMSALAAALERGTGDIVTDLVCTSKIWEEIKKVCDENKQPGFDPLFGVKVHVEADEMAAKQRAILLGFEGATMSGHRSYEDLMADISPFGAPKGMPARKRKVVLVTEGPIDA